MGTWAWLDQLQVWQKERRDADNRWAASRSRYLQEGRKTWTHSCTSEIVHVWRWWESRNWRNDLIPVAWMLPLPAHLLLAYRWFWVCPCPKPAGSSGASERFLPPSWSFCQLGSTDLFTGDRKELLGLKKSLESKILFQKDRKERNCKNRNLFKVENTEIHLTATGFWWIITYLIV